MVATTTNSSLRTTSRYQEQPQHESIQTKQDAFSKYSNNATRLKKLLLKDQDDNFDMNEFARHNYSSSTTAQEEVNCSQECNPQDDSCVRKTRISFEVHPSLLLEDMLMDIYGDTNTGIIDSGSRVAANNDLELFFGPLR